MRRRARTIRKIWRISKPLRQRSSNNTHGHKRYRTNTALRRLQILPPSPSPPPPPSPAQRLAWLLTALDAGVPSAPVRLAGYARLCLRQAPLRPPAGHQQGPRLRRRKYGAVLVFPTAAGTHLAAPSRAVRTRAFEHRVRGTRPVLPPADPAVADSSPADSSRRHEWRGDDSVNIAEREAGPSARWGDDSMSIVGHSDGLVTPTVG